MERTCPRRQSLARICAILVLTLSLHAAGTDVVDSPKPASAVADDAVPENSDTSDSASSAPEIASEPTFETPSPAVSESSEAPDSASLQSSASEPVAASASSPEEASASSPEDASAQAEVAASSPETATASGLSSAETKVEDVNAEETEVEEVNAEEIGDETKTAEELFAEGIKLRYGKLPDIKPQPKRALSKLTKAAKQGHVQAAVVAATMYWLGEGCDANASRAVELFQIGADTGDAMSQFVLGLLYSWGEGGLDKNEAAAVLHLHFAALSGHTGAEMSLGFRHLYGIGVPKSCQESVSYYTRVADKAVAEVQGRGGAGTFVEKKRLSDMTDDGHSLGQIGENEDMLMYYEHSADNGDVQAQSMLGQLYYYGARGVRQDYGQAMKYFEKASGQGDASAMSNLGHMYAQGLGTKQDNATSKKYFEDGVKRNNPASQNGLGYLHMYGIGVKQSYKEAKQYFTQAAENGNPEAQFNLGAMQIAGLGMKRDHSKAVHHFTLAAQQGHIIALYNLGLMHLNGMGTPRSCQVAVQLLKNVAERGPWVSALTNATTALSRGEVGHAIKLYELAGEIGFEIGQANAAFLLDRHTGLGGTEHEHYHRASRWYRRSAQQANVPSELRLGDYFFFGLGNDVDYKKAAAHYRTAAELRNPQSMFNMGYMYQMGLGVPQDFHLAKRYYDMASETSSKAYIPATLALAGLFLHSTYQEHAWLFGDDIENFIIVALSTLLVIVFCAIWVKRTMS